MAQSCQRCAALSVVVAELQRELLASIGPAQAAVIRQLQGRDALTARELASAIGARKVHVLAILAALRRKGWVEPAGARESRRCGPREKLWRLAQTRGGHG